MGIEPALMSPDVSPDGAPGRAAALARARAALAAVSATSAVSTASMGVAPADQRMLPVLDALAGVLPSRGLVRGQVVRCRGGAAWSLALALAAEATGAGSWLMVVALPDIGWQAAAEMGVALERTIAVAPPPSDQWAVVLAAALDGVDIVLAPTDAPLSPTDARRVQARLRVRGGVLVLVDTGAASGARSGVIAPDLELSAGGGPHGAGWTGLGRGAGHLSARRVTVDAGGRRAGVGRRHAIHLPGADGSVSVAPAPLTGIG